MAKRSKGRHTPNMFVREVRQRLRSVLRQLEELREPIRHFTLVPHRAADLPRFFVHFRSHDKPRDITGLRVGIRLLSLPDEPIQDRAWELALTIWHLNDPLRQWVKATGATADVTTIAVKSQSIALCADLATARKHVRNENWSGRNPLIGLVEFDTSSSGAVELAYDGASKEKAMLISEPNSIPFKVKIHLDSAVIDDACAVFDDAMREWIKIIDQLGVLKPVDGESAAIQERLDRLAESHPPVIREVPPPPQYQHP